MELSWYLVSDLLLPDHLEANMSSSIVICTTEV